MQHPAIPDPLLQVGNSPIWHPFTQHGLRPNLPRAVSAQGAYVTTADGHRVLDAISSWWVVTHGHRHPRIVAAIQAQAGILDQVIFAEFTHEPAETLARKLVTIAPGGLEHVFFSDSGSTSVEVALKMALGYWHHIDKPRHRLIVMEHSYHGDTVGTMSVGARGPFTAAYDPLLFAVSSIPFPSAGREESTFAKLDELCRRGDAAAFIVEPLVLGAGGMLMYSPAVLKRLREICATHGVLFIADEVMTGWGRTGTMFACEQAGISPDIACYSKGLTGGAVPLAVTLCTHDIFAAHLSDDMRRTFFHSSSYTANPLACAAAVANLAIWEEEPVLARLDALAEMQNKHLQRFRDDARFSNVRQTGTITAMDLDARTQGYLSEVGPRLRASFHAANVLLRPLGNTVYVMPPYCVTDADLKLAYDAIAAAAEAISSGIKT
jgi:adenosylmethionine-8-amino-7-oxononanoate aminotransferase